jgi:ATP-dependent DNA helicase PIF1
MWRIYGFELSKNYPPVKQLQLHLPDMHMVSFHELDKIERVVDRPGADESMLTAYFKANRLHEFARGILYHDCPAYFTWHSNGKLWHPREQATGG